MRPPANEEPVLRSVLSQLTANALLVVGALFPIVNPLGSSPIFLSLTRGVSAAGRTKLARSIAVNGLVLMVGSIFIGTHILGFFGISLPVVQVGGGLVVISTAWALLRRSSDETSEGVKGSCNDANYMAQAFYPLTLPLTVGPGSISVAITVGANRPEGAEWRWPVITGLLIGALLIALSIYLSYRFAEKIAECARRVGHERCSPSLVVHPGVYRRADSMERIERAVALAAPPMTISTPSPATPGFREGFGKKWAPDAADRKRRTPRVETADSDGAVSRMLVNRQVHDYGRRRTDVGRRAGHRDGVCTGFCGFGYTERQQRSGRPAGPDRRNASRHRAQT